MALAPDPKLPSGGGFPPLITRLNALFGELYTELTGWNDLLGAPVVRGAGANDPTWAVYRNNIRLYQFSNVSMNEIWFAYHIQHDIKPNAEMHAHVHWTQSTVDSGGPAGVPGTVKWQFEFTYAKGHQQAAYPATLTTFVTQQASAIQYQHMLIETQIASPTPTASQIDSALLEPDGILLLRMFRDPTDAADTLNQAPFLLQCDIHYQADHVVTPNKAPPFF